MKVEKCPLCNIHPEYGATLKRNGQLVDGGNIIFCWRHKRIVGITKFGATLRWNRWARREAKRIAKEGKGK